MAFFYSLIDEIWRKPKHHIMKKLNYTLLISITFLSINVLVAQNLKPYTLGAQSGEAMSQVKTTLKKNLQSQGLKVIGEYAPAGSAERWVMVISSEELVKAVSNVGGLTGFAAALRVGLTKEKGNILISYTNPAYWGNAYFRSDYPKVEKFYKEFTNKLKTAVKSSGQYAGKDFGSEDGVELDDLRKYHYMIGMPRFDDPVELNEFNNYGEAVSKIDAKISAGVENVKLVYSLEIPDKNLKLYGFALSGEDGESSFLPTIDTGSPKHTAFLPYEMLIMDGKVLMLHGRYRIALSFPDLTMGTFTKIMSTPGDIKDLLESVTE